LKYKLGTEGVGGGEDQVASSEQKTDKQETIQAPVQQQAPTNIGKQDPFNPFADPEPEKVQTPSVIPLNTNQIKPSDQALPLNPQNNENSNFNPYANSEKSKQNEI